MWPVYMKHPTPIGVPSHIVAVTEKRKEKMESLCDERIFAGALMRMCGAHHTHTYKHTTSYTRTHMSCTHIHSTCT